MGANRMLVKPSDRASAASAAIGAAFAAPIAALAIILCLTFPAAAQELEPTPVPTPMQSLTGSGTPLALSLVVYPSYGVAPLTVGGYADIMDPFVTEVISYYWNFGDGNISTLPTPMLVLNTYKNPGTYLVVVRVVTADGRSGIAFTGVTVRAASPSP